MPTELIDASGRIYLSLEYNSQHHRMASTILWGSEANLLMLQHHGCHCLLNDNRQITGT